MIGAASAASEMAINASLLKNLTYDPRIDFEPVILVAIFPLVFIAPADHEPVAEGIDRGCARQGRLGQLRLDRQRQSVMVNALGASEVQAELRDQGDVPAGTTAAQFRQFVHDEVAKCDRMVSQAGMQLK